MVCIKKCQISKNANMLKENLDIKLISKITGLNEKEITNIKEKL